MTIAVLGGTGKEGQGLAIRLARAGRDVFIGSRDTEKGRASAEALRQTLGSAAIRGGSNAEAAAAATSLVVSTLPDNGHVETLRSFASDLEGKIVVVATIAWPPGPTSKPSAAEQAREALDGSVRVVAAFQTVSAGTLKNLPDDHEEDVLICGDDEEALEATRELVAATGLRGVLAGPLKGARIAESITGLLLKINKQYGVKSTGIRITGIEG